MATLGAADAVPHSAWPLFTHRILRNSQPARVDKPQKAIYGFFCTILWLSVMTSCLLSYRRILPKTNSFSKTSKLSLCAHSEIPLSFP